MEELFILSKGIGAMRLDADHIESGAEQYMVIAFRSINKKHKKYSFIKGVVNVFIRSAGKQKMWYLSTLFSIERLSSPYAYDIIYFKFL